MKFVYQGKEVTEGSTVTVNGVECLVESIEERRTGWKMVARRACRRNVLFLVDVEVVETPQVGSVVRHFGRSMVVVAAAGERVFVRETTGSGYWTGVENVEAAKGFCEEMMTK